jgi:hypothetical protein
LTAELSADEPPPPPPSMSSQIIFLARNVPTVGLSQDLVSTVPSLIEEISIARYIKEEGKKRLLVIS